MLIKISRTENRQCALREELNAALGALRANERAFNEARDPFCIEQLIYQHAALLCRCRVLLRVLRKEGETP